MTNIGVIFEFVRGSMRNCCRCKVLQRELGGARLLMVESQLLRMEGNPFTAA